MKVSEITTAIICQQLREEESALESSELDYIGALREAAVSFAKEYTGIGGVDTEDENGRKLDDYEDITYAVLVMISEMYDQRRLSINEKNVNFVAVSILNAHRFNLVAAEGKDERGQA